jgi:hypothetical protein
MSFELLTYQHSASPYEVKDQLKLLRSRTAHRKCPCFHTHAAKRCRVLSVGSSLRCRFKLTLGHLQSFVSRFRQISSQADHFRLVLHKRILQRAYFIALFYGSAATYPRPSQILDHTINPSRSGHRALVLGLFGESFAEFAMRI